MSTRLTPTKIDALRTIASSRVYIRNDGTAIGGVRKPTLDSLRSDGLVRVNGASRIVLKGRSARRLVLTSSGVDVLGGHA